MKLPNFENWSNGELSKSTKIWPLKSIFYVKNHRNLSLFFIEECQFRGTLTIMPYFWQLAINPKLKIQSFPLGMLILM